MRQTALLVVLFLEPAQNEISRRARKLTEKLGSDRVEERDEAAKALKVLGRAALPEQEKAAKSSDSEKSRRAQILLQTIVVLETLTANLLEVMPGVEERLALGPEHVWTEVIREAIEERDGAPCYPALEKKDLDAVSF